MPGPCSSLAPFIDSRGFMLEGMTRLPTLSLPLGVAASSGSVARPPSVSVADVTCIMLSRAMISSSMGAEPCGAFMACSSGSLSVSRAGWRESQAAATCKTVTNGMPLVLASSRMEAATSNVCLWKSWELASSANLRWGGEGVWEGRACAAAGVRCRGICRRAGAGEHPVRGTG